MPSWWDIIWGGVTEATGIPESAGSIRAVAGLTGHDEIAGAMSAISDPISFGKMLWLNISDYRMWRSLGWLLLGIVLMILGFVVWNRKAIEGATATAAKFAI